MTLTLAKSGAGVIGLTKYGNFGKRLKDGASVKDVLGEKVDKFANRAKTAGKAGVVLAGVGATGMFTGLELSTGTVSKHLPKCVTNLVEKAASSNVLKNAADIAAESFSSLGSFIKAHPVAAAVVFTVGTVGQIVYDNILKNGAKNEGKIEQKYDDIIKIKEASTDVLA